MEFELCEREVTGDGEAKGDSSVFPVDFCFARSTGYITSSQKCSSENLALNRCSLVNVMGSTWVFTP